MATRSFAVRLRPAGVLVAFVVGCGSPKDAAPSPSSSAPPEPVTPVEPRVVAEPPLAAESELVVDVRTDRWSPSSSPLEVSVGGVATDQYVARVLCDHKGYPLMDARTLSHGDRGLSGRLLHASVALDAPCQVEILVPRVGTVEDPFARVFDETGAIRCWQPEGVTKGPCAGLPPPKSDGHVRVLDVAHLRNSKWMALRIVALSASASSEAPRLTVKATCVVGRAPLVGVARDADEYSLPVGLQVLPGQATARTYEFAPVWQAAVEETGAYRCPVTISFEGAVLQEGCMTRAGYEPRECNLDAVAEEEGGPFTSDLRFEMTEDSKRITTISLRGDLVARRPIQVTTTTVTLSCWRDGERAFAVRRQGVGLSNLVPSLQAGLAAGEVVRIDALDHLSEAERGLDCCGLKVEGEEGEERERFEWRVVQHRDGRKGRCE